MVKATSPRVVLPCDDTAVRLMQALVLTPPDNLQPALAPRAGIADRRIARHARALPREHRQDADLARRRSARRPRAGVRRGVRARRSANDSRCEHGYPMVVKRSHSSAGQGVAICADAAALARRIRDTGAAGWARARRRARRQAPRPGAHPGAHPLPQLGRVEGRASGREASEQLAATRARPGERRALLSLAGASRDVRHARRGLRDQRRLRPRIRHSRAHRRRLSAGDQSPNDARHASRRGLRRRSRCRALRRGQRAPVADAARPRSGRGALRRPLSDWNGHATPKAAICANIPSTCRGTSRSSSKPSSRRSWRTSGTREPIGG